MNFTVRKSNERGHADHGWLDSRFTFSFADYYDPKHMHFRNLRVINEDKIAPGGGFPMHPHRDMEIFSYVLEGALEHKDSMGNGSVLRPGQIQLMSAGSGVTHSEFNPLQDQATHMLQIWILPDKKNLTPSYTEWHPDPSRESDAKVLVISRDGREGSATINSDASIYRVRLRAGSSVTHELAQGRGAWLQVMRGSLSIDGTKLDSGDAACTRDAGVLAINADEDAEALLFDLG
ncbi:MAG: pirin family protein [Verrucomicrobia bacterium]|nr:pirin family protein [Verrucomicrobiota bacterium]